MPLAFEIIDDRTLNAIYETGTMRLKEAGETDSQASTSLNTSECIKPGVHFLDVVTFKDVMADELRYALGNILLTTRYGAVSTRVGRMENQVLGVFGGITELPSSLELVQGVYDQLQQNGTELEHPLKRESLVAAVQSVINTWTNRRGISVQLADDDLEALLADVDRHWSLEEQAAFLQRLDAAYDAFRPSGKSNRN